MRLQRRAFLIGGCGNVLKQRCEEGLQGGGVWHLAVFRLVQRCPPSLRGCVDDGEVEAVGGVVFQEIHEEVVGFIHDGADAGVGAVHLVHHHDDGQLFRQRLAQHKPGLREWPFGCVDEEDDAVDHLQAALHLATEVGVARGVDDVDGDVGAVWATVLDGRVFREDGDALLALEVHGVHDSGVDVGAFAECAGLPQHGVDEGGLPVVDVGDDGDVAQVFTGGHRGAPHIWAVPSVRASGPLRLVAPEVAAHPGALPENNAVS